MQGAASCGKVRHEIAPSCASNGWRSGSFWTVVGAALERVGQSRTTSLLGERGCPRPSHATLANEIAHLPPPANSPGPTNLARNHRVRPCRPERPRCRVDLGKSFTSHGGERCLLGPREAWTPGIPEGTPVAALRGGSDRVAARPASRGDRRGFPRTFACRRGVSARRLP